LEAIGREPLLPLNLFDLRPDEHLAEQVVRFAYLLCNLWSAKRSNRFLAELNYLADIAKTQIFAFEKIWDNGFRQITSSTREIRTPEDLNGFKIRVPPAPPLTSLFKAMGAAPAPINFNEL
jgi:TRAP-type C4-dicarboxylate transport system substrate-binding protein